MLLNSLEHCIYAQLMHNIYPTRPGLKRSRLPLSFEPQPERMSHRGRPRNASVGAETHVFVPH